MKVERERGSYEAYKFRILDLLKRRRGPLRVYEIEEAETGIPHSSLMDCLNQLKVEGWIKSTDRKYALFTYEALKEDIKLLVDGWKKRFEGVCFIRPLTLEELMFKVGKDFEDREARSEVRRLAIKHGWIPPEISAKLVEHSRRELKTAYEAWLRFLQPPSVAIMGDEPFENLHGLGSVGMAESKVYINPPRDPPNTNFNLLRHHVEKGCPELLKTWENLKNEASEFLNVVNCLAKGLQSKFIDADLPNYYDLSKREDPHLKPYILLKNAVQAAYLTLKGLKIGNLSITPQKKGLVKVEIGTSTLLHTQNRQDAERFIRTFREELNSPENALKMKEIAERRKKLSAKIESFKDGLRGIVSKIGLGYYSKSFCDRCEHLLT